MFSFGPWQLLILGAVCLLPTAGAVIAVVLLTKRKP